MIWVTQLHACSAATVFIWCQLCSYILATVTNPVSASAGNDCYMPVGRCYDLHSVAYMLHICLLTAWPPS